MGHDKPYTVEPIRIEHDKFFTKVFATLERMHNVKLDRAEIPNQYWKDMGNIEPWYTFQVGKLSLTVGPRKRVVNVTAQSDVAFNVAKLRDAARLAKVTYSAHVDGQDR
ncbi:MAG: hypothetical protein KKF08_18925 [Gammaproteobacteria bacterium]|nr:hypothetical protein [Gammaproteobacteria bacterium]